MSRCLIFVYFFVAMLLYCSGAIAAQSSADVPVTKESIAKARQKVLGTSQTNVKKADEYVIGYGDILGVEVYGEGDMAPDQSNIQRGGGGQDSRRISGGVEVRTDGRISLKHVGDVEAVGFTLTQLADYLKEIFASVYEDPVVTVVLRQSNSQRYTVMGKVGQPGIFYLDYPINIVQVIARSGGFTEWANHEITIVRKDAADKPFDGNTLVFDYDDFLAGKNLDRNIPIKAGDTIIVH